LGDRSHAHLGKDTSGHLSTHLFLYFASRSQNAITTSVLLLFLCALPALQEPQPPGSCAAKDRDQKEHAPNEERWGQKVHEAGEALKATCISLAHLPQAGCVLAYADAAYLSLPLGYLDAADALNKAEEASAKESSKLASEVALQNTQINVQKMVLKRANSQVNVQKMVLKRAEQHRKRVEQNLKHAEQQLSQAKTSSRELLSQVAEMLARQESQRQVLQLESQKKVSAFNDWLETERAHLQFKGDFQRLQPSPLACLPSPARPTRLLLNIELKPCPNLPTLSLFNPPPE